MRELMSYSPEYYVASPEMVAIQQAIQPEIQKIWDKRDELLKQLDPHTATWGLGGWEGALSLTTNEKLSVEQRRSRIIGRLRGRGTTTVAVLQSVVEAFCPGCKVSVVEHCGEYLVELCLTIVNKNIEDIVGLEEALQLIIPAHLTWGYSFFLNLQGSVHVGGRFASVTKLCIPAAADEFVFENGLFTGGRFASVSKLCIPEIADEFVFEERLYAGGRGTKITSLSLPPVP